MCVCVCDSVFALLGRNGNVGTARTSTRTTGTGVSSFSGSMRPTAGSRRQTADGRRQSAHKVCPPFSSPPTDPCLRGVFLSQGLGTLPVHLEPPGVCGGRERGCLAASLTTQARPTRAARRGAQSDAAVIFQDIETPGEDPVQVDACNRVGLGPLGKWTSTHSGDI